MGKIFVAGLGPGSEEEITPAVRAAIAQSDAVVGYKYYFRFVESVMRKGTECLDSGMRKERERAEMAFDLAEQGKTVCVISSGDAGIYGMAPLVWEMKREKESDVEIEVLPGISAFQKAAALLGAPISHDFCVISLSDLMTPWATIEKRIFAAAEADFVTAIYNPKSEGRFWQLSRLKEIFLKMRSADTPVGFVRQAGRDEQRVVSTTLGAFDVNDVDMFTVVIIGNSHSYLYGDKFITPRGYFEKYGSLDKTSPKEKVGREIMMNSFATIASELRDKSIPLDKKWLLLHAIHTTADFDMERLLYVDAGAPERIYKALRSGEVNTIVTDVTMAASGIRKGALERMGIQVLCYLDNPKVKEMSDKLNITRTQAGIRLAVEEHPDALFVFGNAPTALIELCSLIKRGKAKPVGVIGAPVGFVHVCESKWMLKSFENVDKVVIVGRKGGSNLAATLTNAILCFDDSVQLKPGRDL